MIKQVLATGVLAAMTMTAHAGIVINEDFADVEALTAKGWKQVNESTPGGLAPGWFQGNVENFPSQSGSANAYAAANFNNAPFPSGIISSWLITPEFDASGGAIVSFYLRAAGQGFNDTLSYGVVGGPMTTVYPVPSNDWTLYTAVFTAGLFETASFAFHYSGTFSSANYVGLDTVVVETLGAAVPEPASLALFAAGLMGLGCLRSRKQA